LWKIRWLLCLECSVINITVSKIALFSFYLKSELPKIPGKILSNSITVFITVKIP
jgi:hypothetical protein